jgi:hypothetical protein
MSYNVNCLPSCGTCSILSLENSLILQVVFDHIRKHRALLRIIVCPINSHNKKQRAKLNTPLIQITYRKFNKSRHILCNYFLKSATNNFDKKSRIHGCWFCDFLPSTCEHDLELNSGSVLLLWRGKHQTSSALKSAVWTWSHVCLRTTTNKRHDCVKKKRQNKHCLIVEIWWIYIILQNKLKYMWWYTKN